MSQNHKFIFLSFLSFWVLYFAILILNNVALWKWYLIKFICTNTISFIRSALTLQSWKRFHPILSFTPFCITSFLSVHWAPTLPLPPSSIWPQAHKHQNPRWCLEPTIFLLVCTAESSRITWMKYFIFLDYQASTMILPNCSSSQKKMSKKRESGVSPNK